MKKFSNYFKPIVIVIIAVITITALVQLNSINGSFEKGWAKAVEKKVESVKAKELPLIGTFKNFEKILEEYNKTAGYISYRKYGFLPMLRNTLEGSATFNTSKKSSDSVASVAQDSSKESDYSTTNTQVQGVDEADIVKTDGKFIYHVRKGQIVIMRALPATSLGVESIISFTGEEFNPFEMYLDDKFLVVIGNYYNQEIYPLKKSISEKNKNYMPYYYGSNIVKAKVFDISDKKNPKQLREIEIEGDYVSSRKIGEKVYFVTSKYVNYYLLDSNKDEDLENYMKPLYRDSKLGKNYIGLDYSKISYFPGVIEPNYMIIAELNIENLKSDLKVEAYLGAGGSLYVSENNLYAAALSYKEVVNSKVETSLESNEKLSIWFRPRELTQSTTIYRFSLKGGITYTGQGEVPGNILNQFSMDEKGDYFRIATTKGDIWRDDEGTSKNNLYVLDSSMKITGKIEDIAPKEKIYSVRFMGDRAYMVTFRTVDPLFVIDLKDPKVPRILGKLKIPGYSEYLHPYDENHIIGFGKDAIEIPYKDDKGKVIDTNAYYLGMKISIFDVSDVTNPKEEYNTKIGGRGTDSELLNNHKALLFSKDKGLLAFPVTVLDTKSEVSSSSMPEYGEFSFQGAYVYNIDLTKGLMLKGKITHMTDEDYLKAGDYYYYDSDKYVQRIIYIGDTLYTISDTKLLAHNMNTMVKLGEVIIPVEY